MQTSCCKAGHGSNPGDCSLHVLNLDLILTGKQLNVGQGQGEQEQQLRSELSLEKAQMRRQHERELKALQDKVADGQVRHSYP